MAKIIQELDSIGNFGRNDRINRVETRDWIELAEAARLLGVHPSTLRRWADSGKVPHVRTLSGRRRFERATVNGVREEMRPETAAAAEPRYFEAQTLDMARQSTRDLDAGQSAWIGRLSDEQRMLFRYGGQRLLGLMLQFISRTGSAATYLAEGRRVAADYGQICAGAGLSAAQTAEAFLYFRRSILESMHSTRLAGPHDPDGDRIFLRTVDFFDALLVATIESHARFGGSERREERRLFNTDERR
jgi:excisionase family DNA binding protein